MKLDNKLLSPVNLDPRWSQGPFLHLKQMAPKQKGSRFEKITRAILEFHYPNSVSDPLNTDHDFIFQGKKIEVKGSCVTSGTDDKFSFLQIRPLQDYDSVYFVSFWFDGTIDLYELPKVAIQEFIEKGIFKKQHEGNKGLGSTYLYNGTMKIFEQYKKLSTIIE